MEDQFKQLIVDLVQAACSTTTIGEIIVLLQKQENDAMTSLVRQAHPSVLILEQWAWQWLGQQPTRSISQPYYLKLLDTLASWNMRLIFNVNDVGVEIKASLLIPENIECLNQIFARIDSMVDPNDCSFRLISRWLDNLCYLLHKYSAFRTLPTIIHIQQHVARHYLISDQFQLYLTELQQGDLSPSFFTGRQLFYMKTCSFLGCVDDDSFQPGVYLHRYGQDYLRIIVLHQPTVHCWSASLLTCIAHLTNLISACCWCGQERAVLGQRLVSAGQLFYDYLQALASILAYEPFQQQINSSWPNNETILIDATLVFIFGALSQINNLDSFIRSQTSLADTLLSIAQKSSYDRTSICAYGILVKILSDQQLREMKITQSTFDYFFGILEYAWKRPMQRYKQMSITHLLTGFLALSKNASLQQKVADANKVVVFIEVADKYILAFDILWSLSFNEDIRRQLIANVDFISKLEGLKNESRSRRMRPIILGILRNLESSSRTRPNPIITDQPTFDIMISYSHKDQPICKQIYEHLVQTGYRVWIDFDQLHGNVMDAMAQAIDRSQMIIICMSERYRRSDYCRAEAHYAFQRKLKLVPVLLQEHYQPDGWLLFLIGQLLYVDFTKQEFNQAMESLTEELKATKSTIRAKKETGTNLAIVPMFPDPLLVPLLPKRMQDWTRSDVQSWLLVHNLVQMARILSDFNGASLFSLSEYILAMEPARAFDVFEQDLSRRTNESISLLEMTFLYTILAEQTRPERSISSIKTTLRGVKRAVTCFFANRSPLE